MKRHGHLMEQVCDFANLLAAFARARRGCGWSPESTAWFFHLETETLRLQDELASGRYRPGPYQRFRIQDPKPRTISKAPFRDRIVHHAVVAAMMPVYEPSFIADSYATRIGKGTHRAVLRAQRFCRRYGWYLKMDIAAYFASVDHGILIGLLERKIKDERLLALIATILDNGGEHGIGLPVGNLTSQFLANVYLDPLDHLVKDRWGVRGYLRYMDDFVVFDEDPLVLDTRRQEIESFLGSRLRLKAKHRATCLNRTRHGLGFLGRRIFGHYLRLRGEGWRRHQRHLRRCVAEWQAGMIDDDTLVCRLQSLIGHRDALRVQEPGGQ